MAILSVIHIFFNVYTFLLIANVFLSWFPNFDGYAIVRFIRTVTDPYLALFRRFIPPLGPVDLSPIAAFFVLRILEACMRGIFIR